ncbi:MAG: DUF3710 domain-containing protein [Nocardioidaceae bacterium]
MFRRRKAPSHVRRRSPADDVPIPGTEQPERAELARPQGPWDIDDVHLGDDEPADGAELVDLGGLLIRGRPGVEIRLQVDERTQSVHAVLLVSSDGAVELRPFAAPRNASVWDDVRREIGAEATRRGGTATDQQGEFGTEIRLAVPATSTEGGRQSSGTQVSRVVGVSAPRWLLRGTFMGKPAVEPDPDGALERAFRDVVVRRGAGPMAPRSPIPLQLPAGAQHHPPLDESPPSPG